VFRNVFGNVFANIAKKASIRHHSIRGTNLKKYSYVESKMLSDCQCACTGGLVKKPEKSSKKSELETSF
jgi:hypothetical protein